MSKKFNNKLMNIDDINGVLSINKGGTGAGDASSVVNVLSGIGMNQRNRPNGIVGLDNQGKVPAGVLPAETTPTKKETLSGPVNVPVGTTVNYTLTSYSGLEGYVLGVDAGSVSRSGATITYVAPAAPQTVTLSVNDTDVVLNVVPVTAYVGTPSITSPVEGGANLGPDVVITGSAFVANGGSDTHAGTDW